MGKIQKVLPVKLFAGLISNSEENIFAAEKTLASKYGQIDIESAVIPFDFTDYYNSKMGMGLLRKWVSFKKLILPSDLSCIKLKTNKIEDKTAQESKRKVNIDPGYINLSKVVLASTKDFSHRIYLDNNIYAEITLIYKQKEFVSLPWTYPDYKSKEAMKFLTETRQAFFKQFEGL